jgi:protein gp37
MGDKTGIGWTESTLNVVTGCEKVSVGCGLPRFEGDLEGGCYAMALAKRLKAMGQPKYQKDGKPPMSGPGFGVTLHPEVLDEPFRWRDPRLAFVCSMADLLHDEVPAEFIARLWAVMALTPQHTYQVLTKRQARLASLLGDGAQAERFRFELAYAEIDRLTAERPKLRRSHDGLDHGPFTWPLPNVHVGVSAEDQHWADIRIPKLLAASAAVRWVSLEPLLGPVDLGRWLGAFWKCRKCGFIQGQHTGSAHCFQCSERNWPLPVLALDWCVAGGESGPGHRRMDMAWLESIAGQCAYESVPLFVKQDSGPRSGMQGRIPGELWARKEYPASPVTEEAARPGVSA